MCDPPVYRRRPLPGESLRTATLSSAQRDLLREAFKVVKQFRDFLRRHYNFAMF